MAKFVLNRPDDYLSLSKKKIFGTAILWLFILIFCFLASDNFRLEQIA